jgi:hypothetical protein
MRFLLRSLLCFPLGAASALAQATAPAPAKAATSDETIARIVGHSLTSKGAMGFWRR